MSIDPKWSFVIGVITTICLVLSHATIWTGAIPADWIPIVSAWNNIIGTVGTTVMTALAGVSGTQRGPISKMLAPRKDNT